MISVAIRRGRPEHFPQVVRIIWNSFVLLWREVLVFWTVSGMLWILPKL